METITMKVTKAHRLNCQVHTYPVKDSGIRHTVSLTCKCKPEQAKEQDPLQKIQSVNRSVNRKGPVYYINGVYDE